MVDVSLLRHSQAGLGRQPAAITFGHSIYGRNIYTRGFTFVAQSNDTAVSALAIDKNAANGSSQWSHVLEFAAAMPPPLHKTPNVTYNYSSPVYVNGVRQDVYHHAWLPSELRPRAPPSNLLSKHIWTEQSFASFQSLISSPLPSEHTTVRSVCGFFHASQCANGCIACVPRL